MLDFSNDQKRNYKWKFFEMQLYYTNYVMSSWIDKTRFCKRFYGRFQEQIILCSFTFAMSYLSIFLFTNFATRAGVNPQSTASIVVSEKRLLKSVTYNDDKSDNYKCKAE